MPSPTAMHTFPQLRGIFSRIRPVDWVLFSGFLICTLVECSLPLVYGWSATYLASTILHLLISLSQLFRRTLPRSSVISTGIFLASYGAVLAITPINLGISPIVLSAPISVYTATRWIPQRWWGTITLILALIGALGNPVAITQNSWHALWAVAGMLCIGVSYTIALRLRNKEEQHQLRIALALQEQRLSLARDIHDIVGHGLSAIKIQAQTALAISQTTPDDDTYMQETLHNIVQLSEQSLHQVHTMVEELRSSDQRLTAEDITELLCTIENAGIHLDSNLPPHDELNKNLETWLPQETLLLHRVLTEICTNIIRHSGGEAMISLEIDNDHCLISSRNCLPQPNSATLSGTDPTSNRHSHGLIGIQERLQAIGGQCHIIQTQNEFQIQVKFLLHPAP